MLPARPTPPLETPGLELDLNQISEVLSQDARDAKEAPEGELGEELRELYGAHCRAELGPGEAPNETRERRTAMNQALARVREEGGLQALLALRAQATEKVEQALAGKLSEEESQSLLGVFPTQMERYGLSRDGEVIAPGLVTRTLFKARWNGPHGLDSTEGLSETEIAAYWGWLALETNVDPNMRLSALGHYEEASGKQVPEARAVLLSMSGQRSAAAELYEALVAESGSRRLQNNWLALMEP